MRFRFLLSSLLALRDLAQTLHCLAFFRFANAHRACPDIIFLYYNFPLYEVNSCDAFYPPVAITSFARCLRCITEFEKRLHNDVLREWQPLFITRPAFPSFPSGYRSSRLPSPENLQTDQPVTTQLIAQAQLSQPTSSIVSLGPDHYPK